MVLSLIGLEFKILIWVDFWGPMVGWAIRTGMALVGGLMWIFGTLGERDSQRKITLHATGFSILIVVLIGLGLRSGQSKAKSTQSTELNNKAVALINAANYAEGISILNEAIANNSDNPVFYQNRGKAFFGEKKYKESLADFDKAIAMGASNEILFNNRGLVLMALERVDEAIIDYGKSLSIKDDAVTLRNRGDAFYALKKYKESLADFDKAIAMGASNDILFNNRGLSLMALDRVEEAIIDFGKSLEIKVNAPAFQNRGHAFLTQKKYKESLADYDKAIAMSASNDILFNNRGLVLYFAQSKLRPFQIL
jgi:tetratricopeptide (TPR) repeat protein